MRSTGVEIDTEDRGSVEVAVTFLQFVFLDLAVHTGVMRTQYVPGVPEVTK